MDSSAGRKDLSKNKYLVKSNHPGVRHSRDFSIMKKEAAPFHGQEQRPFLCSAATGEKGPWSEDGALPKRDTRGAPQRRNGNGLESHWKNRVLGSRYLLDCSAVQTKSSVNQDQDVFRGYFSH